MNIHEHGLTILLEDNPEDVMTEQVIREFAREYLIAKREVDGYIDEEAINEIIGMVMYGAAKLAGAATKAVVNTAVGAGKLAYKGAKAAGKAAFKGAKAVGGAAMGAAKKGIDAAGSVASGAAGAVSSAAGSVTGAAKGAVKAATGVVGNVGDAVGGTFGGESGEVTEVPKQAVAAMEDSAQGMKGLSKAADAVQSDFEKTIQAIEQPELRDALVSAGETSMGELQTTVNNQLETISANIGAEYEKTKGEPMEPAALRQQAVIALGASVAKVVKDLAQ